MAEPAPVPLDRPIRHVLACLGGSPWLESQVETVAALVRALDARASVLHVAPRGRPPGGAPGADARARAGGVAGGVDGGDPLERRKESAPKRAETSEVHARITAALAHHGLTADLATVSDDTPDRAILRAIEQRGIDLVYAGAAPHESLLRDLLGSTARRIARSARCSVLLDAEPVGRAGSFPVAVVAVTFDEESRAMARFVQSLARAGCVGAVHLVHEVLPAPASALRGDARSAWTITRARADAGLRDFAAALAHPPPTGGAPAEPRLRPRIACVDGRDHSGVLEYAAKVDADLVVCRGPYARRFTFWRWFGSEFEALLTDLPSALLLMRGAGITPKRARFGWR
jgi:nucleotide-binding universal stress UspA family protein